MKYYFIDKKMINRKVKLFDVEIVKDYVYNQEFVKGYDIDGNLYKISKSELIMEEDSKDEY